MLWALDGDKVSSPLALRSLVSVAFGSGGLALVGSAVTPLDLPTPDGDGGAMRGRRATYAQSMRPFEQNAYALVRERHAVEESSASLRWAYAAADLGVLAARAGLLAPAVHQGRRPEDDGLTVGAATRWEARWRLRHSVELDRTIASLGARAPAALWAPFAGGAPEGAARAVVEYFADGAARWALEVGGWNPDLGRSTRADVVAARRIAAALRGDREVSATNGEQRAAVGAAGLALDEHRVWTDAGLDFRCRARLRKPDDTGDAGDSRESAPWRVTFEVVLVDDPTVTFSWSDLAAGLVEPGTTPAGVDVTETSLRVISQHV